MASVVRPQGNKRDVFASMKYFTLLLGLGYLERADKVR